MFATGVIDYRTVRLIVARTLLALEPDALTAIDSDLAGTIVGWGPLSVHRIQVSIDMIVGRHDTDARRRSDSQARGRHVEINHDRRALPIARLQDSSRNRGAMMPRRKRTRAEDRHSQLLAERGRNARESVQEAVQQRC